jgi:hypothetical protein
MKDATQPQLYFLCKELPHFEACGAWERAYNTRYISCMFLVPKHLIIDLRELIIYGAEFNMLCETRKHLRHPSRLGVYFVSLDIADGYYTLGSRGRPQLLHGKL